MSQATAALRRQATSFARRRSRTIESNGGRADAAYVEDLVQDVLTDTLLGRLAWDPEQVSLASHVHLAIRSRMRHDRERADRFPHISVDALDEALAVDVENALAEATPAANPVAARLATEVIAQLRELAKGDRDVLALLDGMCAGFVERADLIQATGMSPRAYKAARSRLGRLLMKLPQA